MIFNMAASVWNLEKLPFWSRELYLHVILHLRSKFCINRPILCRYIAKNDCNMAFVRHLEFAKFRRFDRYSSWELKCVFVYQILSKSDNSRLRYWDKAVFKMVAICHLEFGKFQFSVKVHPRNGNLHLHTKFDRNRIIHSWDMAIMLFSKWRPSAILNLPKLQFWSRGLYRHVILHLCSKFQWRRNR